MTRRMQRFPCRAHGQALTEFLVGALFLLVPLFLAIAALGKFSDVQHTADMAARYTAWERTVWYPDANNDFDAINEPNHKSADAIRNEARVRLLNDRSRHTSIILADDRNAAGFVNGTDPMWQDNAGTRYLQSWDQVATGIAKEVPANDVSATPIATLQAIGVRGLTGFTPPLPLDTLAVSSVTLGDVGKTSASYKRLWPGTPAWNGLSFGATGAILSNTWAANGSGSTRQMVARAVPTAQGLGAFVKAAQTGLAPWDPANAPRIEVGKIAVDVVPEDRLQ